MPVIYGSSISVQQTQIVLTTFCNVCGREEDHLYADYHILDLHAGYGSSFIGDGNVLQAVVCEPCLQKWAETWKHEPEIIDCAVQKAWHVNDESYWFVNRIWAYKNADTEVWSSEYDDPPELTRGIYRHKKGKDYLLHRTVWAPDNTALVYYASLEEGKRYLRPLSEWTDDRFTFLLKTS